MDLNSQKWLLTGANGNIGRRLRGHLRERVAHLVVADLEDPSNPASNETAIGFDITDPDTLPALLQGCDGVIHLAGIADEAPYAELLRVNALGTYNLLEAMRLAGIPRLVYGSSNRITGFHSTDDLLDDKSTVRPDGLYSDKFGLQVSNVRIGSFEEQPTTARESATWLSPADGNRAFEAAMTTEVPFSVFNAVSANRHRFWSLEPGRAIGYIPIDDAADVLGAQVRAERGIPQAGDMASQQYTLDHM